MKIFNNRENGLMLDDNGFIPPMLIVPLFILITILLIYIIYGLGIAIVSLGILCIVLGMGGNMVIQMPTGGKITGLAGVILVIYGALLHYSWI